MCFCALLNCALTAPVPAGAVVSSSQAPALAYAEQLACVLIANLGDGGLAAKTGTEGTQLPTVAALADSLLGSLLKAFPALYNSQACYAALLAQLQEEEGDAPMGQVSCRACFLVCLSTLVCLRRWRSVRGWASWRQQPIASACCNQRGARVQQQVVQGVLKPLSSVPQLRHRMPARCQGCAPNT
jgi:hypothetical protein